MKISKITGVPKTSVTLLASFWKAGPKPNGPDTGTSWNAAVPPELL
jgi:hypothetical protein